MKQLSKEVYLSLSRKIKTTKNLNERIRLCVVLGRNDGHSPKLIASILRISESSVYDYLKEFDEKGKIINKPQPGRNCKLSPEQEQDLKQRLENTFYQTIKDICAYVKTTYNLSYTIPGMRDWLIRNDAHHKQRSTKKMLK
jgi:transposase